MVLDAEAWVLIMLVLLFVKHWYVDFYNQTEEEVRHKGIYGDWIGLGHSIKHGIATSAIFLLALGELNVALLLGLVDWVVHYHIDYVKIRYGCRDITKPQFWNQLGLDQLAHYLTYLLLVALVVFYVV